MKTPFKKLRGLGLHKHAKHSSTQRSSLPQFDELSHASQDMHDMKDCYDSLLSAAAATANSAYEFSESLREMGDCLLEKTSLNDDEDSGRVLLMLGKVQFDIQNLVDTYRSHISRTITVPSESLLNELRIVEEMKRQCDEKRISYDELKIKHKDNKRRLGSHKGEHVSSDQLKAAQEEFDEDATLFVFRMKSLKGGQSRSLLTQAARHHAAQMCFFRKALKTLEAIEPHIKLVAEQQHIDYQFSGLEDDDRDSVFLTDDEDDESDDDDDDEMHEAGELSFEYQRNDPKKEHVSSSENSMELDISADITFPQVASLNSVKENTQRKPLWNSSVFNREVNAGSKSAPLSNVSNIDPSEKFRQMRQTSTRKLNTYALPTPLQKSQPLDTKSPPSISTPTKNMWHSSPLEGKKYEKVSRDEKFSGPIAPVLKESNINNNNNINVIKPTQLPSPLKEIRTSTQIDSSFNPKKMKRYAFSGPLAGSEKSTHGQQSSGFGTTSLSRPSSTTKLSSLSGSFISSPKISELHELPRPPTNLSSKNPSNVGFSAPLTTYKSGFDYNVINNSPKASTTLRMPLEVFSESRNFIKVERMISPPRTLVSMRNA